MTLVAGAALKQAQVFAKGGDLIRASSVDLTIGKMFDEAGTDLGGSHVLKPGQMVFVVSEDLFDLPPDITCFVSCKTKLTHDGVWAITVGIVDPCWCGPISTTLVNFGANARVLTKGMPFLRAAFFRHEETDAKSPKLDPQREQTYYLQKAKQFAVGFDKTFLRVEQVAADAGRIAADRMRNGALFWAAILALFFTGMQTLSVAADRYIFSKDLVVPARERLEVLETRVRALEEAAIADGD